jgi:uncharacterized repeat protein (TIGR01451 family)
MYARILRLIVIVWLLVSPLNASALDLPAAAGTTTPPIGVSGSIGRLNPIELQPLRRPLDAGAPQTITLEITPTILIANSGATAIITATVYDLTGDLVSGVNLSSVITPATLGTVTGLGVTDSNGIVTGTWSAGTAIGSGVIEVGDGVVSDTLNLDLSAGLLASIVVSPSHVSVVAGATYTFTADGVDQYGNSVAITPIWTTNGGAILTGGLFTAQTAVASGRLVTATQEPISGTALVDIMAGPLVSMTIAPNPANVSAGATQIFTAQGYDQFGNEVIVTPTWETDGGVIDQTGLFTAQTGVASGRLVTATSAGITATAVVNINAGPLSSIVVTPASVNVVAGGSQAFSASGFDQYGNPVTIAPVWSTNGGSIDASGLLTADTVAAASRLVTATYSSISGTAVVNIVAGSLSTIVVSPPSASVAAGATRTFSASGYDQYGNAVLITPTWSTSAGTINASGVLTAQTSVATGRAVTATQDGISGTASVNIIAGPLNSIVITPATAIVVAGGVQTFAASGFDQYGNPVSVAPTWSTNGGTISVGGVFTAQTAVATGRLITATQGAISGTASVDVIAGPLEGILVAPNNVDVAAGATQLFTATGFDQYGNTVPVTPTWSSNGGSITEGGLFEAQTLIAAGRLVTATYDSISGTATVNIVAGPLSSIVVSPPSANVVAATTRLFTANGFDQYGNAVTITPTWTTDGGSINSSGVFTAQTTAAAGRLVTATQDAISGNASVNIIAGALSSIVVSPASATVAAGTTQTFSAQGFDQYGNVVSFTPTWTTNGGSIGSSGVFTAQTTAAAERVVTATANSISGTASVTIVAGPLSSIVVSPPSVDVTAGTTQTFSAQGFDQYGNTVTITPTWATSGGAIDASGVFTAQFSVAAGRLVTATQDVVAGAATVNIVAGPLNSIVVSPTTADVTAGATRLFTADGFDQYGNAVPITPTWDTNGGAIDASGLFEAQTTVAAGRLITAAHNSITGAASVNITAGPLNSIVVLPATANVVAGTTRSFTANGFDQYGNAVALEPHWATNGGAINSSGVFTAQFSVATGRFVTATQYAITGAASVNIIAGPLSSISVSPTTADITAGTTRLFTAGGFDQYGNAVPITPTWTTNGGSISSSGVFTAQITATVGRLITATQSPFSGTASVNIVAGPLTSMVISPANVTLAAGVTQVFGAQGFDQYGNTVVVAPKWETDGGTISASGVFTAQTTVAAGRLVTATEDAVISTAGVTIVAGPLSAIVVSPPTADVAAGTTQSFSAAGFDQYGNAVPITPAWTTNGGAIDSSGVFTAQTTASAGRLVTATDQLVSGAATVNIVAGPLHLIKLNPSSANIVAGTSLSFTASGYDQYDNGVPITPTWATNGGSISSSGVFTAQTAAASSRSITATQDTISGTASVNIIAGSLSAIMITPPSATVMAGATRLFSASGFDQYGNAVPLTPTWTTNGGAIDSSGVFTAQTTVAANRLVTATQSSISGTASVAIIAGPLTTITIAPPTASVAAGTTQLFTASGFDQYGNAAPLTPTWTTNGGAIDSSGVFTAQTTVAANRLITATQSSIAGAASVDIIAGPLYQISVAPAGVTLTVATTRTFTASGADQYGNVVPITPTWTTNGGAIDSSGVFTAQTSVAAGRRVTATQGITTGFAVVNVQPGAPYTLTIQPPTAVISAGQRITYTAIATDAFGNAIGSVTPSTNFSITPASGGTFAANVVTPTLRNTWLITGINASAVSTAVLTVTPAIYSRLAIEDAPAGAGSAVNDVTLNIYGTLAVYAAAYDAYDNLIGARTATWSGTGVVAGHLWPTINIGTQFTPVVSGTGTIQATSGGITDTTGAITVQAPLLRISKTASPHPLTPGSPLQYTIVYTNEGNAAAQNVVITETYPPSATFFSAVPAPTSGVNIWSIGNLAVNDPRSIVVFMTTPGQMPVGSVLTNSVQIGAAGINTASYTTTTPVNALPDLSVSVTDSPDPARPGDSLSYSIQYRNDGNAPVSGVRITETYPAEVTFVAANPPPDIHPNIWLTNTLNGSGDSRTILVTVRVNRPLTDTTILNNRVVVSAREASPYTTTQQTLVVAPRLELNQAAAPITPTANSLLTFTLHYTNTGSSYAASTSLTDALPLHTSFVQCEPIGCGSNGGIVTWNLGQVQPQIAQAVTLTVQIANNLPDGVVITNTARITSTDLVAAQSLLTATISSAPDVTLSKSDGLTEIAAGQLTTYTLSYANVGTAPAANAVITDRLPDYMTFVGCTACVFTSDQVYSFTIGQLPAAANGAFTISARLSPTLPAGLRVMTNTAGMAATTPGDDLTNNLATDVNLIATRPALSLTVAYDPGTPYPGKIITYTVRYTNTSAMDTTGVVLTTTRPAWLAGPPVGWSLDGNIDQYVVGNLAARQSGQLTYVVTLPPTYTLASNALPLPFVIQDDGPGGLPAASATYDTFIGIPDLSIAQVIVPPAIVPGRKFSVTLVINNHGSGRACNPKAPTCGGFYVDAFIDPAVPPPSYPFHGYGDPYASVTSIAAGQAVTVVVANLVVTQSQRAILYFKIDNFDCSPANGTDPCLPSHSLGGLVPEFNESNNVAGPILLHSYKVYLPLTRK